MKPIFLLSLISAAFAGGCAQTESKPGSALSIEHQDTSTTVPGNATPVVDRMGVEGTHREHHEVTTGELTPLSGETR
jgi:hypothetical protein